MADVYTLYDPPEGWKYGFPKPYQPLPGETIEQTLERDGYPKELLHLAKYCRFIGGRPRSCRSCDGDLATPCEPGRCPCACHTISHKPLTVTK